MLLTNNILTIEVSEHGAEMTSLVKDGRPYLWTADPHFWNRHAPILFPAVGKPFNNEIHADGVAYPLKQHGFARDSEFALLTPTQEHELRLKMLENELSQGYPYKLGLEVSYLLEENTVKTVWTVTNLDDKKAYFQIGAHPGFLLSDYDPERMVNGYVRFYNKKGQLVAPAITSDLVDGNRVSRSYNLLLLKETPLMPDTFKHDALILENGQVTMVELYDRHGNLLLKLDCPQAEAFGIWAPHKEGCPFVCLEPWCGICDTKDFTGDIATRQYIHSLSPGETYTFTYTIELF